MQLHSGVSMKECFSFRKKNMNIAFQDEMTKKPPSCHLPCIHGED